MRSLRRLGLLGSLAVAGCAAVGAGRSRVGHWAPSLDAGLGGYAADLDRLTADLQRAPELEGAAGPAGAALASAEAAAGRALAADNEVAAGVEAALRQPPLLLQQGQEQQQQQPQPQLQQPQPQQQQQTLPGLAEELAGTPAGAEVVFREDPLAQQLPPIVSGLPGAAAAGGEAPLTMAEPLSLAAPALPEWTAAATIPPAVTADARAEPFLPGAAKSQFREEALDLSMLQSLPQATVPSVGSSAWPADFGPKDRPASIDSSLLSEDLLQAQKLAAPKGAAELVESRARLGPTELETEISAASHAASALAKDAAVLSQALGKLNGILRGAPASEVAAASSVAATALRTERDSLGLLAMAPAQLRPANASSAANSTRSFQSLLAKRNRGLAGNSTGNATQTQAQYTGFKKYFTLGNKITFGWAIVYWIAIIVVFLFLCGWCCCGRLRRAA